VYKHKKLHKAQKGQSFAQSIHVTMRSPASLGILRWGNASEQKLEVGELRSPASHYTLTTDQHWLINWQTSYLQKEPS